MRYLYFVSSIKVHQKIGIRCPGGYLKAAGGAITNLDNMIFPTVTQALVGGIIIASNNKHTHKNICTN